jgi:6-phospho-beta-glucosidase
MLNAARIMERVCPEAWLINFSNPSGIIAEMIARETKVRFAGLCNGPINTEKWLRKEAGDAERFDFDIVGLNHFNWVTRAEADGVDFVPNILKHEDSEAIRVSRGIPSGYVRYYYDRDGSVDQCKAKVTTRGEDCMEIEEKLLAMYRDESLDEKPALLDKRGGAMYSEAAVSLVDAIENDLNTVHVVNVRHGGMIPFLDEGDIAEIKCRVGKDGPVPLPLLSDDISGHIVGMVQAVKAYEKLAVEAGLSGDYDTGLAALLTHPLVGDYTKAKGVYDEMLAAHKEFLPQFTINP